MWIIWKSRKAFCSQLKLCGSSRILDEINSKTNWSTATYTAVSCKIRIHNGKLQLLVFREQDLSLFGDTLVVNTSGTMNAALPAERSDGSPLTVHLSTHLPADLWAAVADVRG